MGREDARTGVTMPALRIPKGRKNPLTTHMYAGIAALGVKAKAEVKSFAQAAAFLGKRREKNLASNVWVCLREEKDGQPTAIAVRLYNTDIITYYSDETFVADNGGYNTLTTANRCNQFGPSDYYFGHAAKQLWASGKPTGPNYRYPVKKETNDD
jgi:hypothetical protein